MIDNLSLKLGSASKKVLNDKVAELLNQHNRHTFEETLGELQFGNLLIAKGLQFSYEPPRQKQSGTTGKPDFAVRSGGYEALVEVTWFRYRVLKGWEDAQEEWKSYVFDRLDSSRGGKTVQVVLPLEIWDQDLPRRELDSLFQEVNFKESGDVALPGPRNSTIQVAWRTAPLVRIPPGGVVNPVIEISPSGTVVTGLPEGARGAVSVTLPEVRATDILFKAMKNKMSDKLRQIGSSEPLIICICTSYFQGFTQAIIELATKRFWPNPQYRRVSGLMVFFPRESYWAEARHLEEGQLVAYYSLNPNATYPIPDELKRAMGMTT